MHLPHSSFAFSPREVFFSPRCQENILAVPFFSCKSAFVAINQLFCRPPGHFLLEPKINKLSAVTLSLLSNAIGLNFHIRAAAV